MHNSLVKKALVCGILVVFIGVSVISTIGGTRELRSSIDGPSNGATQRIIYVDDSNTAGPWDGSLEHPYQHIQDGIDAANPDDTVFVYNGTYYEHVVVNKSLSLIGENRSSTIIDGGGNGDVIHILSNMVNISGFTIMHSGNNHYGVSIVDSFKFDNISGNIIKNNQYGIFIDGSSSVGGHRISGNIIENNSENGIVIAWSSYNNVTENTITRNLQGLTLDYTHYTTVYKNIIIENINEGIFSGYSSNDNYSENIISFNRYGLWLSDSWNNLISKNKINENRGEGIFLESYPYQEEHLNKNNVVIDNIIENNSEFGISLIDSSNDVIKNNVCQQGIIISGDSLSFWNTHIIENNTVYGHPILYYKNSTGVIVPSDAAQIILVNCTNFRIENQNFSSQSSYVSIHLAYSSNNYIVDNILTNKMMAIYLFKSNSNSIIRNTILKNEYGIRLEDSSNNTLSDNKIENISWVNIDLYNSSNNLVSDTNITATSYLGIGFADNSNNNVITNCSIQEQYEVGVAVSYCKNVTIKQCTIQNNYCGVYLEQSDNNSIYHNNFINNSFANAYDESNNNSWDDGYPSGGNYWSNYTGIDANEDGIGDTPYNISGGSNQDLYPLMTPNGWNIDWWPMFRHDLSHSGYSMSKAPEINATLWDCTVGTDVVSSPAVINGRVYIGSNGKVYCINISSGIKLWDYSTRAGITSSPVVADGRIYIGSGDNNVYCLNASTGLKIWNYTTGASVWSSPAVANGRVYIGSSDQNVYCLDASNGTKIWNYAIGYIESSPAIFNGMVYIGSDNGKVYCLNALDGISIWNYTTNDYVSSSPTVANRSVYFGSADHNIYCLNASTGLKIWNYTTGDAVCSSPAIVNGKIYIGSYDSKIYCLNASNGALIWNYTTGDGVFSSPAVADGKVYFGSIDHKIYCLNAFNGTKIWEYNTGDVVYSSPAVADKKVYIGSQDGKVYCFGQPLPNQPPIANFMYTPSNLTDLDIIQFNDNSTDPDGTITSWFWNFGDSNISTVQNPTHQYADDGIYQVSLTVIDDDNANNTITKPVTVHNILPTADFTYAPENPTTLDLISFTDTSIDLDGYLVNWSWDFGDGTVLYTQNPTHHYSNHTTYNVVLTVTDDDGATDIKHVEINVSYLCGDVNNDGIINVADVVYLINYLFIGGPEPVPDLCVGDVNGDSIVNISDVVYLINYLFINGPPPGGCCV